MYLSTAAPIFTLLLSLVPTAVLGSKITLDLSDPGNLFGLGIETIQGNRTSLTFESTGNADSPYKLVRTSAGETAANPDWKAGKGDFKWLWLKKHGDASADPPVPDSYTVESFPCHLVGSLTDPGKDVKFPLIAPNFGEMKEYACKARNGLHLSCETGGEDWPMWCSENGNKG